MFVVNNYIDITLLSHLEKRLQTCIYIIVHIHMYYICSIYFCDFYLIVENHSLNLHKREQ